MRKGKALKIHKFAKVKLWNGGEKPRRVFKFSLGLKNWVIKSLLHKCHRSWINIAQPGTLSQILLNFAKCTAIHGSIIMQYLLLFHLFSLSLENSHLNFWPGPWAPEMSQWPNFFVLCSNNPIITLRLVWTNHMGSRI